MAITIELPHVGESVVEGIIDKWLKKPGDKVEKYDPLVEVVTDKVTMEVPSPVNGVLSRIIAQEGETVPMGAPIAEMESDEPIPTTPPAPREAEAAAQTSAKNVGTTGYLVKDIRPVGPTGGGSGEETPVEPPPVAQKPRPISPRPPVSVAAARDGGKTRLSPAVSRLAEEHKVDLSQVKGTGVGGRITRGDVVAYVESRGTSPSASSAPGQDDTEVPLSAIRRIIAQHMVKSATEIPHAWSMVEVDVSDLVRHRESLKEDFRRREGVDITYLPFVIKAVVESLKEHLMLNSSWSEDKIVLKSRMHIGIAVAAPEGLVVPVIHDADSMSIAGLAKSAADLTARAREGTLSITDVQGGTFTVNNTGSLGSIVSQPIINYPQAAILTTEAIQKRPVVIGDAIAIRSMMNVCMSFDHRIVDGAQSGGFLRSVKARLEAMGSSTPVY